MKMYLDDTREIIQFLRDERAAQGISLRALATKCGMWLNQINHILDPTNSPSLDSIITVGNALGVTFTTDTSSFYDNTAEELINILADSRIQQGITTRQLAEMSGATQCSVSSILSHKVMPRLDTYIRLSQALGVELWLYTTRK